MTDLLSLTADLRQRLPTDEQTELILDARNLPDPPAEVAAPTLVLEAGGLHRYRAVTYERIEVFASRDTYRSLGLLVLGALIHQRRVRLNLGGGDSGPGVGEIVTSLDIDGEALGPIQNALEVRPASLEYWPDRDRGRFPFSENDVRCLGVPAVWRPRDHELANTDLADDELIIEGFGDMEGAANLARLLLDIGLEQEDGNVEFGLEAPLLSGGVDADSAELRFWIGYDYTL